MTIQFRKIFNLRIVGLLLTSFWLLIVGIKNEVPADVGDGLMHFFYAQASWQDFTLFLHHWGKPGFILLSSAFAQFGFTGMIFFNILVFVATILLGYKILDRLGCNRWLQSILPLILILANDYTTTIVGGLTEPLFNLSLVFAFYLFLKEKYGWFAVLISFMPFLRSEGQLPLMLAFFLLFWKRSFKFLPFLATGFIVYAFLGLLASKSIWWYFTESPYQMSNNIYGKGTWDHYLRSFKSYLGNVGLLVFIVGSVAFIDLVRKRDWQSLIPLELIFVYGVFFGVLVAHSYFWATGQNGSLGLTRIATQGMPLFMIIQLNFIGKLSCLNERTHRLFGVVSFALLLALFASKTFPLKAGPMEQQLLKAADYLKSTPAKYKVHYHFPLLVFAYGENPFKQGNRLVHTYFQDFSKRIDSEILPGEFIVWDSHFGPQEAGLPLDTLAKYPQFVKVNQFLFAETNGKPQGVIVYQYIPVSKQTKIIPKVISKKLSSVFVNAADEFTPILKRLQSSGKDVSLLLELTASSNDLMLVYDRNKGEQYISYELKTGEKQKFSFDWPLEGMTDIYLWNPKRQIAIVKFESIRLKELTYHPVMP